MCAVHGAVDESTREHHGLEVERRASVPPPGVTSPLHIYPVV